MAAAAPGSECRDAAAKLKAKYGRDFNLNRFNADIREARAALDRETVTENVTQGLIRSDTGKIVPNLANAIIELKASKLQLAYDAFACRTTHLVPSPWGTKGAWSNRDGLETANHLQHKGVNVATPTAHEAAMAVAHQSEFHPVREYLTALVWDGIPRLATFASAYLGCEDTPYTRAVSEMWPISAVARILQPGCQVKYMIVIHGPQDLGKSKALYYLTNGHRESAEGVQWFRDRPPDITHKDIGLYMQGVWVIEMAELSIVRGKQWETIKGFISSPADSFREPYGRVLQDYPRQCVFAGTTNDDQSASDPTGMVRFWPLRATKINHDAILRDRDQLWAEARTLYDEGRPWHIVDADLQAAAAEEQSKIALDDIWIERVEKAARGLMIEMSDTYADGVTIADILGRLMDRAATAQIVGKALKDLGWKHHQPRVGGGRVRRYLPGDREEV